MRLNISNKLTDTYDKKQANNMFQWTLYQTLCYLFGEKYIMRELNKLKYWSWVDTGPSSG